MQSNVGTLEMICQSCETVLNRIGIGLPVRRAKTVGRCCAHRHGLSQEQAAPNELLRKGAN